MRIGYKKILQVLLLLVLTTGWSVASQQTDFGVAPSTASKQALISNQLEIAHIRALSITESGNHHRKPETFTNLWDRLRHGFRLGNLEDSPGRVEAFERKYSRDSAYFPTLSKNARWFLHYILEQVEKRGMPAEIALVPAIESLYRPDATSPSKAAGMWQFMGSTGRRFGLRQDWWMDARRDLVQSTRAALDYLEFLSKEFDGDWELALAAYNAGEGAVLKDIRLNRKRGIPTTYPHLKLNRETRAYVPRLYALRNILNDPKKYGVSLEPLANLPALEIIDLKFQVDLSVVSRHTSLPYKRFQYLNQGYKRRATPPNGPHILAVPKTDAASLQLALNRLTPTERLLWAHHNVKAGEYLSKIAEIHGVSVQSIRESNHLNTDLIHPGQELLIPLSNSLHQYAGPTWGTTGTGTGTHLVKSGDSLWKISQVYNVKLEDLMQWNNLSKTSILYPGQSIIVAP